MRLKTRIFIFVIVMSVVTISVYTSVLGESGVIRRSELQHKYDTLTLGIEELQREHRDLKERFSLKSREKKSSHGQSARGAVVLKFESPLESVPVVSSILTLEEMRAIFLSTMFFITLAGVALLRRFYERAVEETP